MLCLWLHEFPSWLFWTPIHLKSPPEEFVKIRPKFGIFLDFDEIINGKTKCIALGAEVSKGAEEKLPWVCSQIRKYAKEKILVLNSLTDDVHEHYELCRSKRTWQSDGKRCQKRQTPHVTLLESSETLLTCTISLWCLFYFRSHSAFKWRQRHFSWCTHTRVHLACSFSLT